MQILQTKLSNDLTFFQSFSKEIQIILKKIAFNIQSKFRAYSRRNWSYLITFLLEDQLPVLILFILDHYQKHASNRRDIVNAFLLYYILPESVRGSIADKSFVYCTIPYISCGYSLSIRLFMSTQFPLTTRVTITLNEVRERLFYRISGQDVYFAAF